jgi:hypothetical protein
LRVRRAIRGWKTDGDQGPPRAECFGRGRHHRAVS